MSDAPESAPPVSGGSATAVRLFGWGVLGVLGAFLVNNFLTIGLDWPGVLPLFGTEETSGESWAQAGIYAIALAAAISFCLYFKQRDLRSDAALISNFNAYLIRGCFWAVLLVGVADMAISFLRVEGFLADVVGAEFATQLGRSMYRGPNIHIPLLIAGFIIALYSRGLGFTWLALMIVVAELVIVITRFVFSYEQAFMGDLMRFWYAALFLFASAYTLLADGHVRVDVFYTNFTTRRKGIVNAIGSVLLGMSVCWAILIVGMSSPTAIINSPLMNFEVSQSGFGMYIKYWMAGYLAVFAISMQIQFVSYLMESSADWRGDPGGRAPVPSSGH